MFELKSFITSHYRPEITGGKIDESHNTRFYYNCDLYQNYKDIREVNAICIGPKLDAVLSELEHCITVEDNILIFYYEDIHARWSFIVNNNEEVFIYKKNNNEQYFVKPKNLYIRGCCVDEDSKYWYIIAGFLNFIDMWPGNVICATRRQAYNQSKLFQLANSLNKSRNYNNSISIGKSHVVKGSKYEKFFNAEREYIVKSLSSVRSRVVDSNDYHEWDKSSLQNLPVLFQEKIKGNDLRIHIVNNVLYAKLSLNKDKVDYRYSNNFNKLVDMSIIPDELSAFCRKVALYEDNDLMGIDFLETDDNYIVLEANPSPGWASYYSYKGIIKGPFILDILEALKSD